MKPNRDQEEALFDVARDIASLEDRAAFLSAKCGPDTDLRRRIEEMLEADHAAGEFFRTRPSQDLPGNLPGGAFANPSEKPGDRIGRYKLLQKLGEGGCGIVYMAEQTEPVRRRVALKVIKLGMDTKAVVARFEAERQALAMMDHPNIARVLDAGATDTGRPFFVMELVRGIRITDYCDQGNLSTRERLALFVQVCQAVQHAHQKGIIHRDLKPSNILVTVNDGVPVPKVIDFGIAKATTGQQLTDKTLFTAYEQFIGTPAYMSPEQAVLTSLDIDTRTDIYSLGVLLYEVLTGRTPFDAQDLLRAGIDEMRRRIREEEPVRPSTRLSTLVDADLTTVARHHASEPPGLIHLLRGDLDWIVMKALEKDRARRYETANGLGMDIQRFLGNEPVLARPPSRIYRLQKLARRNRTAVLSAAAISLALLIGLFSSTWQAFRATRAQHAADAAREIAERFRASESAQRKQAVESERNTRRILYAYDLKLAHQAWQDGNLSLVTTLLDAHLPRPGEADQRGFEYFCLRELARGEQERTLVGHAKAVVALAVSPDGQWVASQGETEVRLWDLPRGSLAAGWQSTPATHHSDDSRVELGVSFSHDSRFLAFGTDAGLRLHEIRSRQTRTLAPGKVGKPAFSPVTDRIAFNVLAPPNIEVQVLDYLNDTRLGTIPSRSVWCWSADGSRLLTGIGWNTRGLFEWWDSSTFAAVATNRVAQYVTGATVSPDGRWAAAADWQGDTWILDTADGKALGSVATGDIRTSALAFSPDGRFLATGSRDQAIQVWDRESRRRVLQLRGHQGKVTSLAYTPDGRHLVSGGLDGSVRVWNATNTTQVRRIPNRLSSFFSNPPRFSDDGKWLALATDEQHLTLLDTASLEPVASHRGEFAGFSPDSTQAALALGPNQDPTLRLAKVGAATTRASVSLDSLHGFLGRTSVSGDGRFVALFASDGSKLQQSVVCDATTGGSILVVDTPNSACHCFVSDGHTWACVQDTRIGLWNLETRREETVLDCGITVMSLVASPDGRFLAAGLLDRGIALWDLGTRKEVARLTGHLAIVWALAFSPDGRTLASGSEDRTLRFWDLGTRREVASLAQSQSVYWLAFSPDSQTLVSGGLGTYHVWRAPRDQAGTVSESTPARPDDLPTRSVWRLPDGAVPPFPRMLAEKAQCFTNLLRLQAAVMTYQKDRQRLPDRLEDLVQAHLADTNWLVCPVHRRNGTQPAPGFFPQGGNPNFTTGYSYEFGAETNHNADPDGLAAAGDSMQERRTKELSLYGDRVPLIRCALHPAVQGIDYGGQPLDPDPDWRLAAVRTWRSKEPARAEAWLSRLERTADSGRMNELAWRWATAEDAAERDGPMAVRLAERAAALTERKEPNMLDTLAAAYAENGQFDSAVAVQREALALLDVGLSPDTERVPSFKARLELYLRKSPHRQ